MKKNRLIFFKRAALSLCFSIAIIACQKADNSSPITTAAGVFSFKVDGVAVIADSANALLYTSNKIRLMDVYAYKAGKEIAEFHFDPKAGTKIAGTNLGTEAFLTYLESPVLSYDSQSGNLNVTKCDTTGKKIEGDFSFVGKQYPYTSGTMRTITEGHLSVTKLTKN